MGNNDEPRYTVNLSDYFYKKKEVIDNKNEDNEDEFSSEELVEYGLNVNNNGKIDISSTSKLLNYLKSFVKVNIKKIKTELNEKLDSSDYVVDTSLDPNSTNPVTNNSLYTIFDTYNSRINNKADSRHTHNMSDISSLNTTINTINTTVSAKANTTDLTSHTSNKNNPHGVTLEQLGIDESDWINAFQVSNTPKVDTYPVMKKYGKLVIIEFSAKMLKDYNKDALVFTMPVGYRPNRWVKGVGYKVGSGDSFTYNIYTNGDFKFGTNIPTGTNVRIYDCFFTS